MTSIRDLCDPVPDDINEAVERISPGVIDALGDASFLITGGTGFLGSWLVDVLLALNRQHQLNMTLTLLTRNIESLEARRPDWRLAPEVVLLEGDVRSFTCPDMRFSHVVHAATDTSAEAGHSPLTLAESIVEGSRHVLDLASRAGARCYLYFSSGAVVGRNSADGQPIREDARSAPAIDDPRAAYDNAKRYAEHLHLLWAREHGFECVIARGFAFVGPRMPLDGHFAIGNFIRDAIQGKAPYLNSTGTAIRSYLYAADAAVWLISMLTLGKAGQIYNVGSDQAISVKNLSKRVADIFCLPDPKVPQAMHTISSNSYVPDISRASEQLGLAVWTPLDEAIMKTAQWARGM